jgi:hypothetical protein
MNHGKDSIAESSSESASVSSDRRAQGCGQDGRPNVLAFEPVLGMKLFYLRRIVAWIQNL